MNQLILSLFQREAYNKLAVGVGGRSRGTSLLNSQILMKHHEVCLAVSQFKSAFNNEIIEELWATRNETYFSILGRSNSLISDL